MRKDDNNNEYVSCINSIKNILNNIIKKEIDYKKIDKAIEQVYALYKGMNNVHIIKLIHKFQCEEDIIYTHSLNVALLSAIIAEWCNYSEPEIKKAIYCGVFHDIGKILADNELLDKTDTLKTSEFAQIKKHTIEGYKRLKSLNIDKDIKECTLLHHERSNGSGYPLGITENKINSYAKIIGIADSFEGMTSDRKYRSIKLTPLDAINFFKQNGFALYDSKYLIPFITNITELYKNAELLYNVLNKMELE